MALKFWNPLAALGRWTGTFLVQAFLSLVGLCILILGMMVILLGVDALINAVL